MKPFGLAVCLLWLAGGAAEGATQLSVGNVSAAPGASVSLPISLQSDVAIAAFQAEMVMAPAVLGLSVPPLGSPVPQVADGELVGPDTFRLVAYNLLNNSLPNGTVVTITCSIPTSFSSGTVALTLTNVVLSTPAGLPVSGVELRPGSVRAAAVGNIQIRSATVANGRVQLEISGLSPGSFVIEGSTDLGAWTTLDTLTASGTNATYSRAISGSARQFYRVRLP